MNTSKSLNLRGQLNTIIYEVTDSDDVVKQLADLLVPFIIKREAAIVEAVEGLIDQPIEIFITNDLPSILDGGETAAMYYDHFRKKLRQAIKGWQ